MKQSRGLNPACRTLPLREYSLMWENILLGCPEGTLSTFYLTVVEDYS